jgi:hypothetical protein
MARAQVTVDHNKIRHWAQSRGGHPATVKETENGDGAGILRLDFDPADEGIEKISWEEFFDKFEDADLAFLFQDKTAAGKTSRFHKFVDRSRAEDAGDENEDEDEE